MTRRRTEVIVASAAILVAASFTAAVLIWHFGFDDAWWSLSLPPVGDDWNGFELYAWAEVILLIAFVVVCLFAVVLLAIRRRRAGVALLTFGLPAMLAAGCAAIYWPFFGLEVRHVDRIRHLVKEPAFAYRRIAVLLAVSLVLSLLYLVAASSRHAPPLAGRVAAVALIVLAGVYLHIVWIPMILPATNVGEPVDWQRPDLLIPFRPCRGALLWLARSDGKIIPMARIDDLWLRFADPRRGGTEQRAISAPLEMREGYAWLTIAEAEGLSVRDDDPAVRNCDGRWRRERVVPAPWHTFGVSW
jgi:hypothetical protein